jgi:hypothetical protein
MFEFIAQVLLKTCQQALLVSILSYSVKIDSRPAQKVANKLALGINIINGK